MTTANKITLFRVILIPVFLILLYTGAKWAALAVYIVQPGDGFWQVYGSAC